MRKLNLTAASNAADRPRPRLIPTGVRGRLILLTLAVLIPALLLAGFLLWDVDRQARRSQERQLIETARALSLVFDRELGQQAAVLQALAVSPSLQSGDWKQFHRLARSAVPDQDMWVVVRDAPGRQLVNTRVPFGTDLPATPDAASGLTWAGRRGPTVRVSNLFDGLLVKRPIVVVLMPVTLADGRRVDISIATLASRFNHVFEDQKLPSTWTASILDGSARVVARSRQGARYVGHGATPDMLARMRRAPAGVGESRTLDGIATISAHNVMPGYGWTVVVGVPRSELAGAALGSLYWGLGLCVVLLTLGLALAARVGEGIAAPVEALAHAARAWSRREAIALTPGGLTEIDALAAAFADTVGVVDAREAELRELNASLEARVAERTRELEKATESLIQAQRLEAMGRLTGGVAHDFNNILMIASSGLQLMDRTTDPDRRKLLADGIRQALDRGAGLTRQLLAFARRDALRPETIDVGRRIEGMRVLLDRTLREDVAVALECASDLWPVDVDPVQFELALLNIAVNARDAMPNGGSILLRADNLAAFALTNRTADVVRIAVRDDGDGMAPETVARVFEPFFTTKPVGKGTGLGLSQVYGFAQSSGGEVRIESELGRGTTVSLLLPRSVREPAAETAPATPAAHADGRGRVLLVEDDEGVASVVADMLEALGYHPTRVADPQAALDLLKVRPDFDLVFSDMVMPGPLNGADLARKIAVLRPDLPIVLTTGFSDAAAEAVEAGLRLVPKPYAIETLANELDAALAERRRA